jgi:hypothetical protein
VFDVLRRLPFEVDGLLVKGSYLRKLSYVEVPET